MSKKEKKERAKKYETKVKIQGTFDEVLKVLVSSPPPDLKKRQINNGKKKH